MGWLYIGLVVGCVTPVEAPWCADDTTLPAVEVAPTWWKDARPIVLEKCAGCHVAEGPGPMALDTYETVALYADMVRASVVGRTMPPFLADTCCQPIFHDESLSDAQIATIAAWVDAGAPEGDPAEAVEPAPPIAGLSRVDATFTLPEPYTPDPPEASSDDSRCFVFPYEGDRARWLTGLAPRPENRSIVHHIAVALGDRSTLSQLQRRDEADEGPGFDCAGGLGELPTLRPIGGSLVGGDYPRGIGVEVPLGAVFVVQIHYNVSDFLAVHGEGDFPADQTSIDLRFDDTAVASHGLIVANPAWFVGPGMRIAAGDPEATFWFAWAPRILTGGDDVKLQGVTPHMHRYATRFRMMALHPDGSSTCLLEIPNWEFGWERPYWFAEPVTFGKNDRLYVECTFDNSAANQPAGREPRDIAWGDDDQDMCVGFASFTTD